MFWRRKEPTEKAPKTAEALQRGLAESPGVSLRQLLGSVLDRLTDELTLEWVAVYAATDEEELRRVGLSVRYRAPSTQTTPLKVPTDLKRATGLEDPLRSGLEEEQVLVSMPPACTRDEAEQAGWLSVSDSRVWLTGAPHYAVAQLAGLAETATALSKLALGAASELQQRRRNAMREAEQSVQSKVFRAMSDSNAAMQLFLGVALSGMHDCEGVVVTFTPDGRLQRILATSDDTPWDLTGTSLVSLAGEYTLIFENARQLRPDVGAVYAFTRPIQESVLAVVAVSASKSFELSPFAEARLEHALLVMSALASEEPVLETARRRGAQILDGIAELVDVDSGSKHRAAVEQLALEAAALLGVSDPAQMAYLRHACRWHDVGRAPLTHAHDATADEFLHPSIGAQLIRAFGQVDEVARLAELHHERADGLGFPGARSVAVSDTCAWALIFSEAWVEQRSKTAQTLETWLRSVSGNILPPEVARTLRALDQV